MFRTDKMQNTTVRAVKIRVLRNLLVSCKNFNNKNNNNTLTSNTLKTNTTVEKPDVMRFSFSSDRICFVHIGLYANKFTYL